MIKISSIFKWIIMAFVIVMLGYLNIIESLDIKSNLLLIRVVFIILGILMSLFVMQFRKTNVKLREYTKILSKYMRTYLIVILISSIYTVSTYGYSINELLNALCPFLYVFYAYPILYVFCIDGTYEKFTKKIVFLVVVLLAIKALCWYLYNFHGTVLFPNLLFQYDGWVRDGVQRVDPGYLFGIVLCFAICKLFQSKNKLLYGIICVGLFGFLIFITQFRFQIIVSIIVVVMVYYASGVLNRKKAVRLLILSTVFIVLIAFGGLDLILGSFSVNGNYGGSTLFRLLNIDHYWNLMFDKIAIFGLGLLDITNIQASSLMTYGMNNQYWLADIGIVGGVVRFGIMAIPVYGYLFYLSIKVCVRAIKLKDSQNKEGILFVVAIACYMMLSCLGLNVFDGQRAVDVPFYLAIISYANSKYCRNMEESI